MVEFIIFFIYQSVDDTVDSGPTTTERPADGDWEPRDNATL